MGLNPMCYFQTPNKTHTHTNSYRERERGKKGRRRKEEKEKLGERVQISSLRKPLKDLPSLRR